jgi:hypothetical protein
MDDEVHHRSHRSRPSEPSWSRSPRQFVAELRRRDRVLFGVAALHAALFGAYLVGVLVDPRTVGGEPVWLKPAKFAGSIALVTASLTWVGPHLPVSGGFRRRVSLLVGGGLVVESVLIGGQAARGVESHFNDATALDTAVFGLMGAVIVAVTGAIGWLCVRAWRGEFDVHPAFAAGIVLGLALFVVGAFEGGAMIALQRNSVGTAPRLPVTGWRLVGDFRVAHFVGLHALQVLPLTGYLAARRGDRYGVSNPRRLVRAVAAGYALCLVLTFALAVVPLVA